MGRSRKTTLLLASCVILLVLTVLGWVVSVVFEGERPVISIQPIPEFISGNQEVTLTISDMKRGLKSLEVFLSQQGREIVVISRAFPFEGFFNCHGTRQYYAEFSLDPSELNLAQGRVDLMVRVRDYSRRSGGEGNVSMVFGTMIVDTIPPDLRAVSRSHYLSEGGTVLAVYQASVDSAKSGVSVGRAIFNGYPIATEHSEGYRQCYFTIPASSKTKPEALLWAEDRAGNRSSVPILLNIRKKRLRTQKIIITDEFLDKILSDFSLYNSGPEESKIQKFRKINEDLRRQNILALYNLRSLTAATRLWKGQWLKLNNARNAVDFGDRCVYYYNGEKIDTQVHMGVDLVSLVNSRVPAANNGRVIFSDRLGIYGNTVVLDHGQGLFSVYSHLSEINAKPGQDVQKGDQIGLTGKTGFAAAEHLHFAIMVNGEFVDPVEWWDANWIRDNIERKLRLVNR